MAVVIVGGLCGCVSCCCCCPDGVVGGDCVRGVEHMPHTSASSTLSYVHLRHAQVLLLLVVVVVSVVVAVVVATVVGECERGIEHPAHTSASAPLTL